MQPGGILAGAAFLQHSTNMSGIISVKEHMVCLTNKWEVKHNWAVEEKGKDQRESLKSGSKNKELKINPHVSILMLKLKNKKYF